MFEAENGRKLPLLACSSPLPLELAGTQAAYKIPSRGTPTSALLAVTTLRSQLGINFGSVVDHVHNDYCDWQFTEFNRNLLVAILDA